MTNAVIKNIDITVSLAHSNREEIISTQKEAGRSVFILAGLYKECRDRSYYKLLGWETFDEYLADPQIAAKRSTVYNLIHQYELYVQKLKIPTERLIEIGTRRLQLIAPLVESNPEEWLGKAKELSRSDLATEVGKVRGTGRTRPIEINLDKCKTWKEYVKAHACAACGDEPSDPAHFPRTKGAGTDEYKVIPLCRKCHTEQHSEGKDWLWDNRVNLFDFWYNLIPEDKR